MLQLILLITTERARANQPLRQCLNQFLVIRAVTVPSLIRCVVRVLVVDVDYYLLCLVHLYARESRGSVCERSKSEIPGGPIIGLCASEITS